MKDRLQEDKSRQILTDTKEFCGIELICSG